MSAARYSCILCMSTNWDDEGTPEHLSGCVMHTDNPYGMYPGYMNSQQIMTSGGAWTYVTCTQCYATIKETDFSMHATWHQHQNARHWEMQMRYQTADAAVVESDLM